MNTHPHRGYTLIELIVSVALFTVVMLVAGAAFLTLINLDRRARATNDVVTNLSYVIDSMERSIRTGTGYSAANGVQTFTFTDASARQISYRLTLTNNRGQVEERIGSSGTWSPLTDPRVDVENLDFYARGTTVGDTVQPVVIFVLRGSIRPNPENPPIEFVIESAAAQRLIDI